MYHIDTTDLFDNHERRLSAEATGLLYKKIRLLEANPYRYEALSHRMLLFKIRFSDRNVQKRLIYTVAGGKVTLLFILDRKNNYKDLEHYLRMIGY